MKLLGIILLSFVLTQCKSSKLDNKTPFTIKSATYSGNNNSIKMYITNSKAHFEYIYFNQQKTKATLKSDKKGLFIVGSFKNSLITLNDLELHKDSKKEYGNIPPKYEKNLPNLKENEAILSYKLNDKTHFYKVKVKSN